MINYEDAKIQQKKAEKKCLAIFFISLLILAGVCVMVYFIGEQGFYIALYVSLFVLLYVAYRVKIAEFLLRKEYEGEVTYFNVREERIKETNSHQVGSKYTTYGVLFADIIIKDKKGRSRHKTFRYTKEYDNVKAGDGATFLRFVDKPVIEFKKI